MMPAIQTREEQARFNLRIGVLNAADIPIGP